MAWQPLVRPLRTWWWLIVTTMLLTTVTAILFVRLTPPTYRAYATLIVGRALDNPSASAADVNVSRQLATDYAEIARRDLVRSAVQTTLALPLPPDYRVSVLPNTQLIEISVIDRDPALAQQIAQRAAEALVATNPSPTALAGVDQAFVTTQLAAVRDQISAISAAIGETVDVAERLVLTEQLIGLQRSYLDLSAATAPPVTTGLTIIEPAQLPAMPVGSGLTLVAAAALAGLLLAVGAIYLIDLLDTSIRSADALAELTPLPLLAEIPAAPQQAEGGVIVLTQPRAPLGEAYRYLRTGLQFSLLDATRRIVLVTGTQAGSGEDTTAVSANLAVVLAQTGQRVLLIDADLRRPRVAARFGLPPQPGLTDLALRAGDLTDARLAEYVVTPPDAAGLAVLPAGSLPPNPAELLGTETLRAILTLAGERYDYVILDMPPLLAVSDALVVAPHVDGVLLVAAHGRTRRADLAQALARCAATGAHVLGVVLNGVPSADTRYSYRYDAQPR